MEYNFNWLKEYIKGELPSAKEVAKEVGLNSFELEGIKELEKNNFLIDWDILPNRSSDCLCYLGVAKEITTIYNLEFNPNLPVFSGNKEIKTSNFLSLTVENEKLVKRATKRFAENIKIKESPEWLKKKLESIGQRSINNIVDITNYVMWVTGQPVHIFDYDKLSGNENFKKIFIKYAKEGEEITDLSGVVHILNSSVLVIADENKSLDIAGIKGGINSGVDNNTKRIILSAVNFDFQNIRNTSHKLKLKTDASKRFENEVPLNKIDWAMSLLSQLVQDLAEASVSAEIIDTNLKLIEKEVIIISIQKINSILGLNLVKEDIKFILNKLFFDYKIIDDIFYVLPPFERLDLNIPEDVVEEIGRIYGYQKIEPIFPSEKFKLPKINNIKITKNKVTDLLVFSGFFEVQNRTIVKNGKIKLLNSLSSEATTLRTNLLEGIKINAEKNLNFVDEPKLFEIGKVFEGIENNSEDKVVNEYISFAGIIGKRKIKEKEKENFFYRTKGYLENIFESLSIKNVEWIKAKDSNFLADIYINNIKIGSVGINYWELNFEELIKNIDKSIDYKKPSKYPSIRRDIAFWVPLEYTIKEAKKIISSNFPVEVIEFEIFDIFKNLEENKKSFAFKILFQSNEKTLSDEFANEVMKKIYNILEKENFKIR